MGCPSVLETSAVLGSLWFHADTNNCCIPRGGVCVCDDEGGVPIWVGMDGDRDHGDLFPHGLYSHGPYGSIPVAVLPPDSCATRALILGQRDFKGHCPIAVVFLWGKPLVNDYYKIVTVPVHTDVHGVSIRP